MYARVAVPREVVQWFDEQTCGPEDGRDVIDGIYRENILGLFDERGIGLRARLRA
jgi:hypothetical protein